MELEFKILCIYISDHDKCSILDFEDANCKFFHGASVADVDAEESVVDSLVKVLKLRFGRHLNLNFGNNIKTEVLSDLIKI